MRWRVRAPGPAHGHNRAIWHAFGDVETMTRKSGILAEHCGTVGRNPDEIERSTELQGAPADGDADALADLGFSLFTVGVTGPDYNLSALRAWVAWRDGRNG